MLYFKEIKKVAFSITFAVLVFALIAMSVSQDVLNFSDMIITEPQPGETYGIQAKEIPEQIMPAAFDSLCKEFTANKPVVMIIGGSQGATSVNIMIREALPKLLENFQVVHICGKDKVDNLMLNIPGYKQFEYLKSDLKDVFVFC